MPTLTPELESRISFQVDDIGTGPFGTRGVANITGGTFTGDRLTGTTVGAGADWLLIGGDGFGRLDVRVTFQTHDGANIYVQYHGVLEVTEAIARNPQAPGEATQFRDPH